jgi:hypothetical protein
MKSRGISPLTIIFGYVWRSVANFKSGCFTPGKECRCPFYRRLDGTQSQSGSFREEKNVLPVKGIESRIVQLVGCIR